MDTHAAGPAWEEFGRRLRARRRAAGLTQAELGQRVGYHHSLISRLEAGERAPSPELLRRLDQLLDTGGALRAAAVPDQSPSICAVDPSALGLTLFAVPPGAVTLDLPATDLARYWPVQLPAAGVSCPVHPQTACCVPSVADAVALLANLRAAVEPGTAPARDVDVAHSLAGLLAACCQASMVDTTVDLTGTVERVLQLVVRWLRAGQVAGQAPQAQLRLAAGYAQLAGRMRMHRGQNVVAMAWFGHGVQWSDLAHDLPLRACLLTDVCTLVRLDDDPHSVVSYARALGAVDPRRGWVGLLSHVYLARGYAGTGDLAACRRHVALGRRALSRLDERDLAEAPWLDGEAGVLRVESMMAGALRDVAASTGDQTLARQAIHATRRSLSVLPTAMRPTYLLLRLRLADSLACAGEPVAAVEVAGPVATEAARAGRAGLTRELAGVRHRLSSWSGLADVRELEEQLQQVAP